MKNSEIVEWKNISWRELEKYVFKLQNRIFKASQEEDLKKVRKLQKTLMQSKAARSIAVRKVTQDNQGKHTAGVDKIKSLIPDERLELVNRLKFPAEVQPTRRVWIPKPGTEEKRPLGIPTMDDRALQALAKQALEPEWEARFEANSFGFRPGRSAHDAIDAIFCCLHKGNKYILDADIAKCFDLINHQALLEKINTFPKMRKQIKRWLKAGVMDGKKLFPTEEGTPQGGVISPLLANIALHGLETFISNSFPRIRKWSKVTIPTPSLQLEAKTIRYADDFVVIHDNLDVILKAKAAIEEWLKPMGLKLKPSKTRITHSLNKLEGNVGFEFLGFSIRQFKVSKNRSGFNGNSGKPLGFKTIIKPSDKGTKRHYGRIGEIIDQHKALSQEELIMKLNPVIRGWSNYYSTVVSAKTFHKLDNQMFWKLWAWAKRRHRKKNNGWRRRRYWHVIHSKKWVFGVKEGKIFRPLRLHYDTPIQRHVKVKGTRSPFDGDWIYWGRRMGKHPETTTRMAELLKKQKGKCTICYLNFKYGDILETDHIIPRSLKGKETMNNLQLLHKHCHINKTSEERRNGKREASPKGE